MGKKIVYGIRKWKNCNRSLINYCNLTIWFSEDVINRWYQKSHQNKKRGRSFVYSDAYIELAVTIRTLFHLLLRATQGFLDGLNIHPKLLANLSEKFPKKLLFISLTSLSLILSNIFLTSSVACTRVLFTKTNGSVLVGNNMDWPDDMRTDLVVSPRGQNRIAKVSGRALEWTSKYGSVFATVYGIPEPSNGMNERGLAVHLLGLKGSDYGVRNDNMPGLNIDFWAQFYLDNFQTVNEAVQYTQSHPFQIVTFDDPRFDKIQMHLALEDATGDSAIIEYVNGRRVIYHDKKYTVVTNQPTYDKQLENVKLYAGMGGDKPLPGTTYSQDRFVRASYYLDHMSASKFDREAIFKLLSILQNAGQPYGRVSPEREEFSESIWRTVSDLTNRVYYFNSSMRFNIFWVKLDEFNLEPGAPIMKLDLQNNTDFVGDVFSQFKPLTS